MKKITAILILVASLSYGEEYKIWHSGNSTKGNVVVQPELDPVWTAVSNTVTSGAALGATATQPNTSVTFSSVDTDVLEQGSGYAVALDNVQMGWGTSQDYLARYDPTGTRFVFLSTSIGILYTVQDGSLDFVFTGDITADKVTGDLTGSTKLPLSGLAQSGITVGQPITWNGTNWDEGIFPADHLKIDGRRFGVDVGYLSSLTNEFLLGEAAGYSASGDGMYAFGIFAGHSSITTNSTFIGPFAGRNAVGDNDMFIAQLGSDPGASHDPTTESQIYIDGDNDILYLGSTGGVVQLRHDPATAMEPATKQYVDDNSGGGGSGGGGYADLLAQFGGSWRKGSTGLAWGSYTVDSAQTIFEVWDDTLDEATAYERVSGGPSPSTNLTLVTRAWVDTTDGTVCPWIELEGTTTTFTNSVTGNTAGTSQLFTNTWSQVLSSPRSAVRYGHNGSTATAVGDIFIVVERLEVGQE